MSSNGPIDDEPAPLEAHVQREGDPNDARRLQRSQQNRRYRENHPQQAAATRRKWVDANRDRVREYNRQWRADNLERARELNRESNRRVALRKKKEAELRASARERAKRWRESHLDEVRIYQARWVGQNPEKVRVYYNNYYQRHRDEVSERAAARRDADPEPMKRARKAWAERNRDRLAELQRTRRRDPDIYQAQLEANAAARRLKRRLKGAGLPPKQLHPTAAAERRANDKSAAAYFNDPGLSEHVRQADIFTEALTAHMLEHGAQMRSFAQSYLASRERAGLPPIALENTTWARAVEFVLEHLEGMDQLSSRDIAAAVRSSMSTVHRAERARERNMLLKVVVSHVDRNRRRLAFDAAIENRARVHAGRPTTAADALVVRLAFREVSGQVPTGLLTHADIRWVYLASKLRYAMSTVDARPSPSPTSTSIVKSRASQ